MTETTYSVSVPQAGSRLALWAVIEEPSGELCWWEQRGRRLTADQKDRAVADAAAAGMTCTVLEHDGQSAGGRIVA